MPDTFWQRVKLLVGHLKATPFTAVTFKEVFAGVEDVVQEFDALLAETEETHKYLRSQATCLECGSPLRVPADPEAPPRALFCQNINCKVFAQFVDPGADLCPPEVPQPQAPFLSAIAGTVHLGPEQQFPGNLVIHDDATIVVYHEGNRPLVKFKPIQRVVLAAVEGGELVRHPVKIETVTETGSPRVFYTGEEYVSVTLKRDILRDLMTVVSPHCRTADGIADARRAIARVLDTHLGGGETPVFD